MIFYLLLGFLGYLLLIVWGLTNAILDRISELEKELAELRKKVEGR